MAIVHGDYRLDNTVLDDDGNVAAILDWEICTLGDPLADLGLLLVYWAEDGDPIQALLGVAPTTLPGFASRAELRDRYAAASGLDVSSIPYYRAFGFWKLACILQGVYARYAGGAAAGDRPGVDQFAGDRRSDWANGRPKWSRCERYDPGPGYLRAPAGVTRRASASTGDPRRWPWRAGWTPAWGRPPRSPPSSPTPPPRPWWPSTGITSSTSGPGGPSPASSTG